MKPRSAGVKLVYNGTDITADIAADIESISYDSADALTVRKDTVMTSDDLLNEEETKQEIAEMLK